MRVLERIAPGARVAGPENIQLPAGYEIEPVAEGLNYPTAVSWDVDGYLLVAESRFPYGKSDPTEPRVLHRVQDGTLETLASGFGDLITDITVYNGLLYVAHRGGVSVVEDGRLRGLVTDLPSWGLYHNNALVFGRDGRMYFGQGTVSDAGVVGGEAVRLLSDTDHLDEHDIPGASVALTGQNYDATDPLTGEARATGAFVPWGTMTPAGHRVPGPARGAPASGAIMSADFDGSDLRMHAWGIRNPYGLAFAADGGLYATGNGAALLPPRPVANDPDALWSIEEGVWYGWPDYIHGRPVTDPAFAPAGGAPHGFLIANHDELLRGRTSPPEPVVALGQHVSARHLDFCLHPEFGYENQAFVAEFGPLLASYGGLSPAEPIGRKVVRIDLARREVVDWAVDRAGLPPSQNGNRGGLERPIEAKFGPDGNLYIVDYGIVEWAGDRWEATAGTGIVWRVTHSG